MTHVEFIQTRKTPPPNTINIDDLISEFEAQDAEAIAQGRQWVAGTFYGDRLSLAQLRLKNGLSQAELARRVGTSQAHIARIELRKTDPQLGTVKKIAQILGVATDVLVNAILMEE
ncbi:MAG: helix-turn-helix transcriptional regulator [Magnetococcales bacterium]|nr:helix-turn-helix transcriptional regulator [Magnetococcales bacterium]MBF0113763.1 helix-turn-helix transcriptional regulator [Magnetococcales bacterium]